MTLTDLEELCTKYVPKNSRHQNSWDFSPRWWSAHELGHLIVAAPRDIGRKNFGLIGPDDGLACAYSLFHLSVMELAAMAVSAKLLIAVDRFDLVLKEEMDTDYRAFTHETSSWLSVILRRRGATRIPRDRHRLERMLARKTAG